MICWRIDLHKKLASYVQGNLSADSILAIEDHLTQCESCRDRLARVLEGDRLMAQLPVAKAPENAWEGIESAIHHRIPEPKSRYRLQTVAGIASVAIVVFVLFVLRDVLPQFKVSGNFDRSGFSDVPLSRFDTTAQPHVKTEGYVSDVRVDEEDGDLMFKLVDDLQRPNHFVVCEIIAPLKMQVPSPGSRIRVYGVSRYDGQLDHQWYEVHPVLNIEAVR